MNSQDAIKASKDGKILYVGLSWERKARLDSIGCLIWHEGPREGEPVELAIILSNNWQPYNPEPECEVHERIKEVEKGALGSITPTMESVIYLLEKDERCTCKEKR